MVLIGNDLWRCRAVRKDCTLRLPECPGSLSQNRAILADMNRIAGVADRLAATFDIALIWASLVLSFGFTVMSAAWVTLGLVRGAPFFGQFTNALHFWVSVASAPFWLPLTVFGVMVVVRDRRRRLKSDPSD